MSGRTVPAVGDWRKAETLTVDEWCAISRTSRFHVYRKIKADEIPAFQTGDSYRIPVRWARVQLGEIKDDAYAKLEPDRPIESKSEPPRRGRGRPSSPSRAA
jgi:excisionase family DNA binding protein